MKLTNLEKKDIIMSKINNYNHIIDILKNKYQYENSLEPKNSHSIFLIQKEIEKGMIKINVLYKELNSLEQNGTI